MTQLRENPPAQRFSYVVKQHPKDPAIVLATFDALAHTVIGDDSVGELVAEAKGKAGFDVDEEGADYEEGDEIYKKPHDKMVALVRELVKMVAEHPEWRRPQLSDPLWPWAARELSRVTKQARHEEERQLSEERRRAIATGDSDDVGGRPDIERAGADALQSAEHALYRKAPALALWVRDARPDLGQVTLIEALEAVEAHRARDRELPAGEVIFQEDGWTVQSLTTKEQLAAEGEVMQHCVGSYCGSVDEERTRIYSLRDPAGKPHVTMESELGDAGQDLRLVQIQGKQNQPPKPEYMERVQRFIREAKVEGAPRFDGVGRLVSLLKASAVLTKKERQGLHGVDLTRLDAPGAELDGADLSEATLASAAMPSASLRHANLRGANLYGIDLGIDYTERFRRPPRGTGSLLDQRRTLLDHADLTDADLTWALLGGASLVRARLERVKAHQVRLEETDLSEADLRRADLFRAQLHHASLGGARLDDANLTEADLTGTNVDGASFRGAQLVGAKLYALKWKSRPRFDGADVRGAFLAAEYPDEERATLRLFVAASAIMNKHQIEMARQYGLLEGKDVDELLLDRVNDSRLAYQVKKRARKVG